MIIWCRALRRSHITGGPGHNRCRKVKTGMIGIIPPSIIPLQTEPRSVAPGLLCSVLEPARLCGRFSQRHSGLPLRRLYSDDKKKVGCRAPASRRSLERRNQFFDRHPPAKIRIDKARTDATVTSDHERCRDRQYPGIIALIFGQQATE